ncbi:9602_t:CDS:2 [Paraglomus occultum]|uniref:9602_t:CDS:1 n=1 Tax=Paraglomus occultum TaxID=144539 RepID=A0A9N9A775_9GLOM|nr:9602_t:CDS:2 [Paraglomus occultum]
MEFQPDDVSSSESTGQKNWQRWNEAVDNEDVEEYVEDEEGSLLFDYIAVENARRQLVDRELENIEDETIEEAYDNRYKDSESCDEDICIPEKNAYKLSPCVVIDKSSGTFARCNSECNLEPLSHMIGTWEVDVELGECAKFKLHDPSLALQTTSVHRVRFICSECFEANGGHLHIRQGSGHTLTCSQSGHHNNDIKNGLQTFSKAILNLSKTDDEERQRIFLTCLNSLLITSSPETSNSPPSLFATKVAMRLQNLDFDTFSEYSQIEDLEYRKIGEFLGNAIIII